MNSKTRTEIKSLEQEKDSFLFLNTLSKPSNTLYNFLLFSVLGVIALLPFLFVDISSSAPLSVQTLKLKETVVAPVSGKIVKFNLVDNKNIHKGDTLLVIDNPPLNNELNLTKDRHSNIDQGLHDISAILGSLQNQSSSIQLYTSQYRVEYQNYLDQRRQLAYNLESVTKTYNRNKQLFDEKVIAASEFEQHELAYNQAKTDIDLLQSKFKSKLETDRYQFNTDRNSLDVKEKQLIEPITNSIVTANTSGVSYKAEGIQLGSFIQTGQKLLDIIPDTGLIATCLISPKDIGFIKIGQALKIQIDAYNYYDWGLLHGKVYEIFKDVDLVDNKPYYVVYCKLDKNYLTLKNGYKGSLIKGMTGKAFFYLNRKSLWQLVFTKVNDWLNPKQN